MLMGVDELTVCSSCIFLQTIADVIRTCLGPRSMLKVGSNSVSI